MPEFFGNHASCQLLLEVAERVLSAYQFLRPKRVYLEGIVHHLRKFLTMSLDQQAKLLCPSGKVGSIFHGAPLVFEETGSQHRWRVRRVNDGDGFGHGLKRDGKLLTRSHSGVRKILGLNRQRVSLRLILNIKDR